MKTKLAIFDLDGTLYDTRTINYHSYRKALLEVGADLDFDYFARECNGKKYTVFLPGLVDAEHIETVHKLKKKYYSEFLDTAVENAHLFSIIECIKQDYHIALVTTASNKNCHDLLRYFGRESAFELILTQEDVVNPKPDPQGFIDAMNHFNSSPENTIIFEDSEVGIVAGQKSGATVFVVKGFA